MLRFRLPRATLPSPQPTDFDEDFLMKSFTKNECNSSPPNHTELSKTVTSRRDCDVTTLNADCDDATEALNVTEYRANPTSMH